LSEESRTEIIIEQPQAAALTPAPVPVPPPAPQKNDLIYLLVAAIIIVAALIIYLLFKVIRRKSGEGLLAEESSVQDMKMPAPQEMLEGKTVKIAIPPAGTLKLLPGRLLVISGEDKIKELRFYKTKTQDENEILFGRASGSSYNYVQLKSMTVSAKHAKMLYAGGKFTIINYSGTNPVKVNGKELEVNGATALNDGDRIELGEVVFEFRAQ
ncbi:MAG: FHA domain-containing protein, partial [Deltaproteobacteria bacterium]|nr:FHA domain-containing protein [Deltaproteobacteria bacterium]